MNKSTYQEITSKIKSLIETCLLEREHLIKCDRKSEILSSMLLDKAYGAYAAWREITFCIAPPEDVKSMQKLVGLDEG